MNAIYSLLIHACTHIKTYQFVLFLVCRCMLECVFTCLLKYLCRYMGYGVSLQEFFHEQEGGLCIKHFPGQCLAKLSPLWSFCFCRLNLNFFSHNAGPFMKSSWEGASHQETNEMFCVCHQVLELNSYCKNLLVQLQFHDKYVCLPRPIGCCVPWFAFFGD